MSGRFLDLGIFHPHGLRARRVRAHLPDAVTPGPQTPTLYVFDGQNAFGDEGTPHGGWHLHQALAGLDPAHHALPVVVAIDSTDARMDELCPWRAHDFGGLGDRMLDFVIGELFPHVERELGVPRGPLHRVLGGTSMGGLLALYGHFRDPGEVGGALALSPSFWPADAAAFRVFPRMPTPAISRVYLDCGDLESEGRMIQLVSAMASHLGSRGYPHGQLWYVPAYGAHHTEKEWRARLPAALAFMFRR